MRVRLAALRDTDLDSSGLDLSDMMTVTHERQTVSGKPVLTSRTLSYLKLNFVVLLESSARYANTGS